LAVIKFLFPYIKELSKYKVSLFGRLDMNNSSIIVSMKPIDALIDLSS
jgi:hypothetical protein